MAARARAGIVVAWIGASLLSGTLLATATASTATGSAEEFEAGLWWYRSLNLDEVHETVTGDGVQIALLDGPVSPDVPELQGQDVRPTSSKCHDADRSGGPSDPARPVSAITMHPTSMAALLVGNGHGNGPGGRGVPGIAPGATLRTYALYDADADPAKPGGLDCEHFERMTDGDLFREAVADGAEIVAVPFAFISNDMEQAISEAILEEDVIVVVGVGNDGPRARPIVAAHGPGTVNAVAIGEHGDFWEGNSSQIASLYYLTEDGQLTDDPEKGVSLAPDMGSGGRPVISASGVGMTSGAVVDGRWVSAGRNSGTSGSVATVAGALALAMERWPEATGDQILQSLVRNANRPDGVDYDRYYGFGGLSLAGMLQVDPTQYPDVHPFYGGLRWAFHDDPPEPFPGVFTEEGVYLWYPTYTEAELELPHPRGPLDPEVYRAWGTSDEAGPAEPPPHPEAAAAAPAQDGNDAGIPGWAWGLGGTTAVAVAALLVLTVLKRRTRTRNGGDSASPPSRDRREPQGEGASR